MCRPRRFFLAAVLMAVNLAALSAAPGNATPALWMHSMLAPPGMSSAACVNLAIKALDSQSLSNVTAVNEWTARGYNSVAHAAIQCVGRAEGLTVAIAVAGSDGYGPQANQVLSGLVSSMNGSLQAASAGLTTSGEVATVPVDPPTLPPDNPYSQLPPPSTTARIVVREPVYAGQPFTVDFSGLPGLKENEWISVELAESKPWSYQQYHYTQGRKSGTLQFNGLPAGTWELRLYHDASDTTIRARTTFTIR